MSTNKLIFGMFAIYMIGTTIMLSVNAIYSTNNEKVEKLEQQVRVLDSLNQIKQDSL